MLQFTTENPSSLNLYSDLQRQLSASKTKSEELAADRAKLVRFTFCFSPLASPHCFCLLLSLSGSEVAHLATLISLFLFVLHLFKFCVPFYSPLNFLKIDAFVVFSSHKIIFCMFFILIEQFHI